MTFHFFQLCTVCTVYTFHYLYPQLYHQNFFNLPFLMIIPIIPKTFHNTMIYFYVYYTKSRNRVVKKRHFSFSFFFRVKHSLAQHLWCIKIILKPSFRINKKKAHFFYLTLYFQQQLLESRQVCLTYFGLVDSIFLFARQVMYICGLVCALTNWLNVL